MDSGSEIERLAEELRELTLNGVRRPLPDDTSEADIALLAEIVRELADDPTLPLSQLIAEAVHPAVQRAFTDRRRDAAAELLDIDLSKEPNDPTLPVTSRKLGGDRRVKIQELMGWVASTYNRDPPALEGKALLKPVAEQLLALRDLKRRPKELPLGRRRLLVGGVGLLLSAVGVVWLVVQLVNG